MKRNGPLLGLYAAAAYALSARAHAESWPYSLHARAIPCGPALARMVQGHGARPATRGCSLEPACSSRSPPCCSSTAIGTACAYGLWKRGSRWISGPLYLSLVTPEIVNRHFAARVSYPVVVPPRGPHLACNTGDSWRTSRSPIAYVVVVVAARLADPSTRRSRKPRSIWGHGVPGFWGVTSSRHPTRRGGGRPARLPPSPSDDYVITSLVAASIPKAAPW